MFFLFRKARLLYKTSKMVYWRLIFTIYDVGIEVLLRVTRGYKELQGVTRGYRGLQGVTRGDMGLQGVTSCFYSL